ncbi:S8 family serine peptidase [Actinoplanes sp. NEAU-A12]|uniref:S8 family serine peptidase n=1 Tax=Actinoplanes sandaracinus TaxID=3045177 RepID=A0ABT6WEB5_9ACTN|nr:S8 family serine peptidase [Actinoplanes sandaracinus]MDI6098062.1 S8 family serine peptidase [Actinoplanes sandaracinus]
MRASVVAAPGQNCAQPGEDRINGSWPRVMLQADAVEALENGGNTRVAVLSTGVDGGQPQLGERVLTGADTVDNAGGADQDCTGTGTQVAGVISGSRTGDGGGVSPGSVILPIRVMPDDPAGSEPTPDSLARGILTAVQNQADVIVVAAPVYDDEPVLKSAVSTAVAQGVVVVAAAGDLGSRDDGNPDPYPASYPDVIGVGAIDQNGQISPDSQFGRYVDLVAPGVAVPTLQTGRGLVLADGTAVAAGFVGAAAALIRARERDLPPGEVARRLIATASPAPAGPAFGAGVVSPYAALTARIVDSDARRIPALRPPRLPDDSAELRRRAIAVNAAVVAAILAGALLLAAAALRRSRRQWRPGLSPRVAAPPEPLEPGPPVMLLDTPPPSGADLGAPAADSGGQRTKIR